MATATKKPTASNGRANPKTSASEVDKIPLAKLFDHPQNPEPTPDELKTMRESLKSDGQWEPIIVRPACDVKRNGKKPPAGSYEVLAGKTRRLSAKALKWATLEAVVRRDLTDERDAVRVMAGTNQKRRVENPIRQALMIQAMKDAGHTNEEAGALYELKTSSAVLNKLQLLKLPAWWQDRVISGEVPESVARMFCPFVGHKSLIDALTADAKQTQKSKFQHQQRAIKNRDECGRWLDSRLDELTRPVDGREYYRHESPYGSFKCYFKLTPALEISLNVVTLPIGKAGKGVRVALDVKQFDKLNAAGVQKAYDRWNSPYLPKGAAKATPTSTREKAAAAAKKTAAAVNVWKYRFLRCLISDQVKAGHYTTTLMLPLLMAHARRRRNAFCTEAPPFDDYFDAACVMVASENDRCHGVHSGTIADAFKMFAVDKLKDEIDLAEQVQAAFVRFLIWPQCEVVPESLRFLLSPTPPEAWRKPKPKERRTGSFLLDIDAHIIDRYAEMIGVKILDGWKRATIGNSRERALVREFFCLHTRGQLDCLAAELLVGRAELVDVENAKRSDQVVDAFMNARTAKKPLVTPGSLGRTKARIVRKK